MARSYKYKGLDVREAQGAMAHFDSKWNYFQAAGCRRNSWCPSGFAAESSSQELMREIRRQKEEDARCLRLISAMTDHGHSSGHVDGVIAKSCSLSFDANHLHSNAPIEVRLQRNVERKFLTAVSQSSSAPPGQHRTSSAADHRRTSMHCSTRGPHLPGSVARGTLPPPPFLPILTVPNASSVYPSNLIQRPLVHIYRPYLPTLPPSASSSPLSLNIANTLYANVQLQSSAFLNATSLLQLKLDRCSRTEVLTTTAPFRFPNAHHISSAQTKKGSYLLESVSKFCTTPSSELHKYQVPSQTAVSDSSNHPTARRRLVNWLVDSNSNRNCQPDPEATTEVPLLLPVELKTAPGNRFRCDRCGKVYATFGGLERHKDYHCTVGENSLPGARNFSCKQCSKVYSSLGAMKMHTRTHTLPCKCQVCGKAFSRPWLLQGHLRTHTGEKPFGCSHCGRAFADRSNLRAHQQTHAEVKKYSCSCCTKTFSRLSLLVKHTENSCPSRRHPKKSSLLSINTATVTNNQLQTWSRG